MPPAFNLSQDQTLQFKAVSLIESPAEAFDSEEQVSLAFANQKLTTDYRLLTLVFADGFHQREHPHKLSG